MKRKPICLQDEYKGMVIKADVTKAGIKYWFTGPSKPICEADLRIWIERMMSIADAAKEKR